MKHLLIVLALACLPLQGQVPLPSGSGGGGVGVGAANVTATSAPAVTSLAIDITTLNLASINTLLVQCWAGTAAPYTQVTITSLNPVSLTSVTANFTSTANVTCRANSNGGAGQQGNQGIQGNAGNNGTNGAISRILDETTPLTVRADINFTGSGVACVDNAGAARTDCTISGGGGAGAAPYGAAVSAQTTLSVTAATHGQGTDPIAMCYEGTTPFIAASCYYTKATNGDIVFTWAPAFTGRVVIIGGGTGAADTAVMLSRATDQAGTDKSCTSATGNDTYTCTLTPALTAYSTNGCLVLKAGTANTGAATVNVDGLGAKSILTRAVGALSNGDITANAPITICYDGTQFIIQGDGGGGGGSGDFVGPASSTDNAFVRFDGTTGKLGQNSTAATLDDSGNAVFLSVATGSSPPACAVGTAGANCLKEGTAPSAATGVNILYADSTAHKLYLSENNGAFRPVIDVISCQGGLGDGLNAIAAGTYLQTSCQNNFATTFTITGISCFTDNSGSSTMTVANGAGTALLTGAVTCTSSFAAGTQSGTTTIAAADYMKFTFVADGTSKQTTWVVKGTR